jgi:hypothetical protein
MTCEDCGAEYGVGDWYRCPHEPVRGGRGADVTWPGGKTFENLADQPMTFYSPAEKAKYLRNHNIEEFVRHQPVPGSDKSPHTTSWAAVSQATLDGAKAMLERVGQGSKASDETWVRAFEPHTEVGVTRVNGRLE